MIRPVLAPLIPFQNELMKMSSQPPTLAHIMIGMGVAAIGCLQGDMLLQDKIRSVVFRHPNAHMCNFAIIKNIAREHIAYVFNSSVVLFVGAGAFQALSVGLINTPLQSRNYIHDKYIPLCIFNSYVFGVCAIFVAGSTIGAWMHINTRARPLPPLPEEGAVG